MPFLLFIASPILGAAWYRWAGALTFRLTGANATDHGSNALTRAKASKSEILSGMVGMEMLEQAIDVVMEKLLMQDVQQTQSTTARRFAAPLDTYIPGHSVLMSTHRRTGQALLRRGRYRGLGMV